MKKEVVLAVSKIMSLSSVPLGFLLSDGLSSLYTGNPISDNSTTNPNSNNDLNYQTNQYQHHPVQNHEDQGLNSQLFSAIFSRDFNRQSKQSTISPLDPETLIPANNYNSFSLLSFLYAETDRVSSTPPPYLNSGYPDYDEILASGDDSVQDAFVEGSHLWSLLVVGYCIVFVIGGPFHINTTRSNKVIKIEFL